MLVHDKRSTTGINTVTALRRSCLDVGNKTMGLWAAIIKNRNFLNTDTTWSCNQKDECIKLTGDNGNEKLSGHVVKIGPLVLLGGGGSNNNPPPPIAIVLLICCQQ